MEKKGTVIHLIIQLYNSIESKMKKRIKILVCIMVFSSIIEIISIMSFFPLLSIVTGSIHKESKLYEYLNNYFEDILLLSILIFIALIWISGACKIIMNVKLDAIAFDIGSEIGYKSFKNILNLPYDKHLILNSSDVIALASKKVNIVTSSIILPTLNLLPAFISLIFILSFLLIFQPALIGIVFFFLFITYFLIGKITKNKKIENSIIISKVTSDIVKIIQEALGSIRDVLINKCQKIFLQRYKQKDIKLRKAQLQNQIISQTPRNLIELIVISILIIIIYINHHNGKEELIPVIGILIFSVQKAIPSIQIIYLSCSSIYGGVGSLVDILKIISPPINNNSNAHLNDLKFEDSIILNDIKFKYNESKHLILDNVNLEIKKGSLIGIIGITGSGKSTLLDVIMGLLNPTSGSLIIDQTIIDSNSIHAWQKKIAHVPQNIFLIDDSIRNNIVYSCFDNEELSINQDRFYASLKISQLENFIKELPNGVETVVGERGIRLSGGQRQRIGLARAIYSCKDVLILDEATSALDNNTEQNVIEAIKQNSHGLTIFMVAHRLTSLRYCDLIVKLEKGKINKIGSYHNIIG